LSPELAARRQEILARAENIDREDYFQMLGIDRTATPEQARDVFFALAKTWHPDRLPPQLADVRDACARIFGRISEAHQTLSDPKKRDKYMTLLKDGGATPEAQASIALVVEAATNFQKAEVCLKRNDTAQAEALCRKAHEADPEQPDYLAMLAWLEALKPDKQSPEATRASIAMLDKAIGLSEKCERAFFYRGLLQKRLGNHPLAARDFRMAAELNPRNIDAVREVRLYEMRKERGSVPPAPGAPKKDGKPSGGLFGKLFKK
jgi:curved DNA-binding protein CbpA